MAITVRYSTNTALQYGEIDLSDYLFNDVYTGGTRKFLTDAPITRMLGAEEAAALYFLSDDPAFQSSLRYRFYDKDNNLLNEHLLASSVLTHNAIPVNQGLFYQPEGTVKMTIAAIGTRNLFSNPDFSTGTGNLFTSWTLTQPSRTNLILRSQEFDNASWIKVATGTGVNPVVTANFAEAPDGTMTADKIVFNSGVGTSSSDVSEIYQQPTTSNGSTYTEGLWLKGSVGGEQLVLYGVSGVSPVLLTLTNEWQFFSKTDVSASAYFELNIKQGIFGTINSTATVYAWGAQVELGSLATPYIPTTSATVTTSVGEFLQNTTGGILGSRALMAWAGTGTATKFGQSISLTNGLSYTIRFKAKNFESVADGAVNIYVNGSLIGTKDLTDEYTWQSISFTSGATSVQAIEFVYVNDPTYGFAIFDDMEIFLTNYNTISEERIFIYDLECHTHETQLQWQNKKGGCDTWNFTGYPITAKDVSRNIEIEYPMDGNFIPPKRIYANRENVSRERMTLFHRCNSEAEAAWLRSDIIDSIDVKMRVGNDYYPIRITDASVVIDNTFKKNLIVIVNYRMAFDINVQTI